jgi:hypothetical protein
MIYNDFIAGEDRETIWYGDPIDDTKDARAVITFTDRAGNDTTIKIEYFAFRASIQPGTTKFGKLAKGEIIEKDFWLFNQSNTHEANIRELFMQKNNQGFVITNIRGGIFILPVIIPPMDSIAFKVRFVTNIGGKFVDSIVVGDSCLFRYKAHVEATGDFVGVEDEITKNAILNIYPNPSDGNAVIEFNSDQAVNMTLFNELGVGFELPFMQGSKRVELKASDLASGVYHLVMRSGTEVVVRKLVIQK